MGKTAIRKLDTNIPVTGVIKYIDFQPSQKEGYSDQIALRCVLEPVQYYTDEQGRPQVLSERIYRHVAVEGLLKQLGIVGNRQANGNYPLLLKDPRVTITKLEKSTDIKLLGHGGASNHPASGNAQGTATSPPRAADTPNSSKKARWESMLLTHAECIKAAMELWKGKEGFGLDTVGATADTLFTESARQELWRTPQGNGSHGTTAAPPPPKISEAQKSAVLDLRNRCGYGDHHIGEWLSKNAGGAKFDDASLVQADQLILWLSEARRKQETEDIPF